MIEQVLNRQFILEQMDALVADLRAAAEAKGESPFDGLSRADYAEAARTLAQAGKRERSASSGQPLGPAPRAPRRTPDAPRPLDDLVFISHDPLISLTQSVLEEHCEEHERILIDLSQTAPSGRRGAPAIVPVAECSLRGVKTERSARAPQRRLFGRFELTDIRWASSLVAMGLRELTGRHPFKAVPAERVRIPDRAQILLVGDWGTGLPRARKVAKQMRLVLGAGEREGVEQHVIHLGDVYYSGRPREYRKRLLAPWPVDPEQSERVGSWTLNGNHDMYSGGAGYFDVALADPRFARQQRSSFFSLENSHWRILGLDTAYDDHDLRDPQGRWVAERLADGQRKTMLLSHHQPFSAYEGQGPKLTGKLASALAAGSIDAWFWGHEHRCMTFAPHAGVRHGRLIGHGGVPVYMNRSERDPVPAPATYEYRARLGWGFERWAKLGFCVLDLDGEDIGVSYIDEDGTRHLKETIR